MRPPVKGIMMCVEYGDLLAITLPINRHHFDELLIVTTPGDEETQEVALKHDCGVFQTTSFFDDGATLNKFKAMEFGLDMLGREGWLCLMDADTIWPRDFLHCVGFERGKLYGPPRRIMREVTLPVPPEDCWGRYPLHPNTQEWPGYTQIFHAEDPVLGSPPWHEINWKHCGGADSMFQYKWKNEDKVRLSKDVLHLGECGVNWCGRATPKMDGTRPLLADARIAELHRYFAVRRGKRGPDKFDHEKVRPKSI